jgi:serine protein kinase
MDVISNLKARYERLSSEEMSLEDYLAECKRNPLAYATAAERMLKAIGEPTSIDTRNDPRMSRLFANKVIKVYPAFAEFYGMEDAIEQAWKRRSRSSTCWGRWAAARAASPNGSSS